MDSQHAALMDDAEKSDFDRETCLIMGVGGGLPRASPCVFLLTSTGRYI